MLALAQRADQLAILGVAGAIGAGRRARLHECLDVVEDQQAAPLAKELNEPRDLVTELLRWGRLLIGDRTDGLVEELCKWWAVSQRAEQHHIKLGQNLVGERNRQAGLADSAKPEDGHQAAALVH